MGAKKETKVECVLTEKQQGAVVGLARMFLICHRTGEIFDMKTGKSQSAIEYANSVLTDLGIDAVFRPPLPVRELGTLKVVDERGRVLPGKVSKDLESSTRRDPKKAVGAYKSSGWWRPSITSETKVFVRETQ